MERTVMVSLAAWKDSPRRKPLLLSGARQVGKTWLLQEFGRRHYSRTLYVSLDQSATARAIFDGDIDIERIVADLAVLAGGGPVDAADTLIVLDEVQEAPRALTALKYFAETAPQYHVACAGSLLGVAAHPGTSFPVGKVNELHVGPATFDEFLRAVGELGLADLIAQGSPARLEPFHEALITLLRWYLFVGGMPEAVAQFGPERNADGAREVQREVLSAYDHDFSKHAPLSEVPRLRALFASIPRQLARENRRFVVGQAQAGARSRTMEPALQWLLDAGLVFRVPRVSVPRVPLSAYADDKAFKLYLVDTGLVGAMADLDPRTVVGGNAAFVEFKGALTEQYVLQSLIAAGLAPSYWVSRSGAAEIDFVVATSGVVVPIEVKAATNLQAKSLRVYRDAYNPPKSVRTSLAEFRDEGWLVNVPLYAIGALPGYLEATTSAVSSSQSMMPDSLVASPAQPGPKKKP
jgi:predicted AAA+ superfamily ATPase